MRVKNVEIQLDPLHKVVVEEGKVFLKKRIGPGEVIVTRLKDEIDVNKVTKEDIDKLIKDIFENGTLIQASVENYVILIYPKEEKVRIVDIENLKVREFTFHEIASRISDEGDFDTALEIDYSEKRLFLIMIVLALKRNLEVLME